MQLLVRGPVARLALTYLDTLSEVVSGEREPVEECYGFRTTLSARCEGTAIAIAPAPVRSSIDREIKDRAAASEELIYLETQFFRDFALADALAEVALEKSTLKLLMILPAAPDVVAFDHRKKLDAKFRAGSAPYHGSGRVYGPGPAARLAADLRAREALHLRRRVVLVSFANLNGRSLHWDTEAGIVLEDAAFAPDALRRCLDHWIPGAEMDATADLVERVREQAELDVLRQPENRDGFLPSYDFEPARAFGTPLPGFPHEMV